MSKASLKYAIWKVLTKYRERETGTVRGIWFNKIASLLNHELLESTPKLDIRLPRVWYFFGEEVVPRELPPAVKSKGLDKAEETRFWWSGARPKSPGKKAKRKIDSLVDSLYSRFPPHGSVHDVLKAVYEYAPFDFQRYYAVFRSDFSRRSELDVDGTMRAELLYPEDFARAMQSFPSEDFPMLRVSAKKLEYVIKAIFEEFPGQNQIAIDMAKEFWETFSKFLRVHDDGHHNVSDSRLGYWNQDAVQNLEQYKGKFHDQVAEIVANLRPETLSDPMLLAFLQPVSLESALMDISSEIDETLYG